MDAQIIWIPIVLALLAAWMWYRAVRQRNSGIVRQNQTTGKDEHLPGKLPFHKIGSFWYAVGLTIAAIGSFLLMQAER